MKNRKLALVDYLAIIGLCVWGLGLLVLMAMGKIQHFERYHKVPSLLPFVLSIIWILLGFGVFKLFIAYVDHQDKNYRAAHVTQHTFTDERFGTLTLDYDSLERRFESWNCPLPRWGNGCGKDCPSLLSVQIMDDSKPEEALVIGMQALGAAYDREEAILAALCSYVTETYAAEDIPDMTPALVRKDLDIIGFEISVNHPSFGTVVTVQACMLTDRGEHIAEHGASIDLRRAPGSDEWQIDTL